MRVPLRLPVILLPLSLREDHEKQIVQLANYCHSKAPHVDGAAISSRSDYLASSSLERLHGSIHVANTQLQPRRTRVLDPGIDRFSIDSFEFEKIDLQRRSWNLCSRAADQRARCVHKAVRCIGERATLRFKTEDVAKDAHCPFGVFYRQSEA